MTDKKSNNIKFIAIVGVAFLVLMGAMFFVSAPPKAPVAEGDLAATEAPISPEGAQVDEAASEAAAPSEPLAPVAATASIDVNSALSDRVLGDTSAAVRIAEHASFSCSHCAHFHKEVFPLIKKNYIDMGKAYLVFSDFPLDQTAMAASMVSRCLTQDKYWDFVSELFATQEDWARTTSYLDLLKKAVADKGLTSEQVDACVNNKELQDGIANRMKGVSSQWNVTSTPSFVINNKTTHAGALTYEQFSKIIDEEIAKAQNPDPSASGAETTAPPDAIGDSVGAMKDAAAEAVKDAVPAMGASVDALKETAGEALKDVTPALNTKLNTLKGMANDAITPEEPVVPAPSNPAP
jgi:protein-disulfide isomerase